MSSRNAYLAPADRERARRALPRAARGRGRRPPPASATRARRSSAPAPSWPRAGIEPEYLEARDADDACAAASSQRQAGAVAVAARVGAARLIDNT